MKELLAGSAFFGVALSLSAYYLGTLLKKRFKLAIFNPILIAVALTIGVLLLLGIDYESYNASAKYLSYLLTPATVSLAIPFYEQLHILKKNARAIALGILGGALTSLACIALMALILGLDHAEYATLLPKSVTTAIGMPLAGSLGGYESVAAVVIIVTGIVGNMLAPWFLKLIRVTEPIAKGVAIGTASHAVGTAKAIELGEVEGAVSGLSIAAAGLFTVLGATLMGNLF